MLESSNHNSIDALLPPEMAERAEQIGVEKTRRDTMSLLALAVLAGAFIAFASLFAHLTVLGALLNLVWVTLGNMIGGVMVGITYWFIHLRKAGTKARTGQ